METMYSRIVSACKSRGFTPSYMCVKLGIRKAIMSDLKSGKSATIRTDTVVKFADFLGVSTDYLLTGKEFRFPPDEQALLDCWRKATLTEKQNIAFVLRDYGMPMPADMQPEASEAV